MKVEQAVESMKKSLIWENWSDDQADSIRTLLLEVEKVKVLEEENSTLRSRNNENQNHIINDYKELLVSRHASFKKNLLEENFIPDAKEVWNMYSNAFYENNGVYYFIEKLLKLELFDKNGRLNEFHICLDHINKNLLNLCSEYVMKILPQLPQPYNSASENEADHELVP